MIAELFAQDAVVGIAGKDRLADHPLGFAIGFGDGVKAQPALVRHGQRGAEARQHHVCRERGEFRQKSEKF